MGKISKHPKALPYLFLSEMWERFGYTLKQYGNPTFGDFKRAAEFKNDGDVRDYFRKKAKGEVKEDAILGLGLGLFYASILMQVYTQSCIIGLMTKMKELTFIFGLSY